MGLIKLSSGVELHTTTCCVCGTTFGMDLSIEDARRQDGRGFHCPNGHVLSYGDNELSRTKKELAAKERALESQKKLTEWEREDAKQQRQRAEVEQRRGRSLKGHQTRLRKRLADGKCPCCEHAFVDLEKHIAEKHPRYKPQEKKDAR